MILGDKTSLVALDEAAKALTLRWANDPDLRRVTGARYPVSEIEHDYWFRSKAADDRDKTFGIRDVATGTTVGIAGFKHVDYVHSNSEVFLYLGDKEVRGRGLGTSALRLLSEFCFAELNMHKLYAYIYVYNAPSVNLFEKCDYVLEGTLKGHWFRSGRYHDVLIYSKFTGQ